MSLFTRPNNGDTFDGGDTMGGGDTIDTSLNLSFEHRNLNQISKYTNLVNLNRIQTQTDFYTQTQYGELK